MAVDNLKSEWYFGFCEISDNAPWWMKLFTRFSPDWCRHVYCFCQAGPFILFVEPSPDKLHLDIKYSDVPLDVVAAKELLEERGHKVVKSNHEFKYPKLALLPSCVTIAKTVSGYRSRAITPYGLYKELINE